MSGLRDVAAAVFRADRYLIALGESRVGRMLREGLDRIGLWQLAKAPVSAFRRWVEAHESYESKVRRENAYFSSCNVDAITAENWQSIPRAMVRLNQALGAADGEVAPGYFLRWVLGHTGVVRGRGIDVGCGPGDWPRQLIDAGLGDEYDAFDVAEGWIAQARSDPRNHGYQINFYVADVNAVELPAGRYAVVFFHDALHHVLRLEHAIGQLAGALAPGGWLVLSDYVGPSRMQWTDAQLAAANALLTLLPEPHRRMPTGELKRRIRRPDPSFLSPFEGIRSAEIMPLLLRHPDLELVEARRSGGLLPLIVTGIAQHLAAGGELGDRYVDIVWEAEQFLDRAGTVPGNFVVAVFRRRPADAGRAGPHATGRA